MTNFHGWTDHKSFVAITVGRTRRYGIAKLGKKDKFNLILGVQIATLKLFLTPKTLSAKPKGDPFEVEISLLNLYYEVWRVFLCRGAYHCGETQGECSIIEEIANNIKVAITFRAPGIKIGFGFWGHPDYASSFKEVEKTLYFLLTNTHSQFITDIVKQVAEHHLDTETQLFHLVEPFMPAPASTALADNPHLTNKAFEGMELISPPPLRSEVGRLGSVKIIHSPGSLALTESLPVEEVNGTLLVDSKALAAAGILSAEDLAVVQEQSL